MRTKSEVAKDLHHCAIARSIKYIELLRHQEVMEDNILYFASKGRTSLASKEYLGKIKPEIALTKDDLLTILRNYLHFIETIDGE